MGVGATPAAQRSYVKRLAAADVSGLGFGLGFSHEKVPRPLIAAAEAAGLPLFEVPYPVPFIALTEAIFTRILAEQYDTLQRAVDAEHVLTRAVMDGKGIDGIADSLAGVTKGWVLLLDLHGLPLASTGRAAALRAERVWDELRDSRPEGTSFSVTLVDKGHHIWVLPVGAQGRVEAFLAVGKPEQLSQLDRIVAGHALSLFAMELAKSRAVADAERRLQGDFFDQLAKGELSATQLSRGLSRFGFERGADVIVLSLEGQGSGRPGRRGRGRSIQGGGWLPHLRARRRGEPPDPGGLRPRCRGARGIHRRAGSARTFARAPAHRSPRPRWAARCARRPTRCRCAAWRGGSTPGSRIWGPTDCSCP